MQKICSIVCTCFSKSGYINNTPCDVNTRTTKDIIDTIKKNIIIDSIMADILYVIYNVISDDDFLLSLLLLVLRFFFVSLFNIIDTIIYFSLFFI